MVQDTKYRRFPIPKGGLENLIVLIVNKVKATVSVFQKMKHLIEEYYMEPEKITANAMQSDGGESRVDEDLDKYGPEINSKNSDQVESVSLKTRRSYAQGGQYNGRNGCYY